MKVRTEAQVIEIFHLIFLRVLTSNRGDWFILKGGANLRYFFNSPRYSNDLDLDVDGRRPWQITESVNKILASPGLALLARQAGIELAEYSAPKQSETTQRWKLGLSATGHAHVIRTKVEFSDRGGFSEDIASNQVPNTVVDPYGVNAPVIRHYQASAAAAQKIAALALRSETKARDVFDLDLLFRRLRSNEGGTLGLASPYADAAAERALHIGFSDFISQVAPFLDAEVASLYDEQAWDLLRLDVADRLSSVPPPRTVESEQP